MKGEIELYLSNKNKIIVVIVSLVLVSFFIYKYFQVSEPPEINLGIETSIGNADIGLELKEVQLSVDEEKEEKIMVDVKGAVNNPGVYQMNEEDRVIDAINKAGGLLQEADLYQVNLAESVYDEMEIIVPRQGEVLIDNFNDINNGKININHASIAELIILTGIGEEKAKAIIKYRQENGDFNSIEEIMNVSGIAEGIFEQIKDNITV